MGSNAGEMRKMSENDAAECSATTVKINIKTLDSQTFTLRVDKCVPVPELKQQIASVTGVLSEQQRLICRGKVLTDDQLLSAYHVEDGHTLHMVVRQPVLPSEDSPDQPGTDPTSSSGLSSGNRVGPGMLVGTFNISEQGDGSLPDLNRIVSAVLSSFGLTRFGSGVDGIDLNQTPLELIPAASGPTGPRTSSSLQADQVASTAAPMETSQPHQTRSERFPAASGPRTSSSLQADQVASTAAPVETSQPQIIPDSLTTLLQYLSHLTREFNVNSEEQNTRNTGFPGREAQNVEAAARSSESHRVVTPEFLAEVILCTRQLLVGHASDCLLQFAGQLSTQSSMADPSERSRVQSYAIRSGTLFQNLGASLLELGRAAMTLRMGQLPADALVNAGPSVFISQTGRNPIMVQPLPFEPGASFGSVPVGSGQHGSGSGGSGFRPRNIDIRIRTGSVFPRREQTFSQPQGQGAPLSSSSVNSILPDGTRLDSNSHSRESQVRQIPIRRILATVPSPVRHGSDLSRGSIGILYPLMARVQHVSRDTQTSDNTGQHIADSAAQPQSAGIDGSVFSGHNHSDASLPHDHGLSAQMPSGLEFLRTVIMGDHDLSGFANPAGSGLAAIQTETAQDISSSEAAVASTVTDEGILLSNMLRQILPRIAENSGTESNVQSTGETNSSNAQTGESSNGGSSSRRRHSTSSQQNPKRQRRD